MTQRVGISPASLDERCYGVYSECVTTGAKNEQESSPPRVARRRIFVVIYLLFLLLAAELGARAFWRVRGVPFLAAHRLVYRSFYPGVASIERVEFDTDEDCFDILLLGGSVLHNDYGDVEHVLRERLIRETHACVNVHNLAEPAHTSLDSFYKYKHLANISFDLVVLYHGINEVRANNCSAATFREDYSHFSWYKLINDFEARADARWVILPYTVEFVALKVADRIGWRGFLPTHEPSTGSLDDGCEVKTAGAFRRHYEGVLEVAKQRGEPVLLMTFAFFLPESYAKGDFESRKLDYTVHAYPVELWGKPECVVKVLIAHEEVVASLAASHPDIHFVDQRARIPGESLYYNDICHLTHEGCERFVENMLPPVRSVMKSWASR